MSYRILWTIPLLLICLTAAARASKEDAAGWQSDGLTVDPKVTVSICFDDGSMTVRGWDHNSVRVRTRAGLLPRFQLSDWTDSNPPRKLNVVSNQGGSKSLNPCIAGDVELDVPHSAGINVRSGKGRVSVRQIAKLTITTEDGPVDVQEASQATDIKTMSGAVSIKDSKGSIKLHSVTSRIEVHNVKPNQAGEIFKATSLSGDIALALIGHSLVKASSLKGNIDFVGPLVWAGRYNFQTVLGYLRFSLPPDSSFRVSGTLATLDQLNSDFSLQTSTTPLSSATILDTRSPNLKHIYAAHGDADIMITLASLRGAIYFLRM